MKFILSALIVIVLAGCTSKTQTSNQVTNLPQKQVEHGTVIVSGETLELALAQTDAERIRGLSGTSELPLDGMMFIFEQDGLYPIWMKDMQYAIDIVWLDGARVVDVAAVAQPQPGVSDDDLRVYTPSGVADTVLELAPGRAGALGIVPGSHLEQVSKGNLDAR
jgi:uncharacterized membrane protein (UPF0127 family)